MEPMTSQQPVPIDELLAHRAWVRTLAPQFSSSTRTAPRISNRRPGRGRSTARRATRVRCAAGSRAFARHVLIDARRAESRRVLRELAVARPRRPRATTSSRGWTHCAAFVQTAYELPEPYRTTLLLRYFEGLSIREIAQRVAAPQETVRTRLKRALEQMRARLDAETGGDRGAWCAALMPLALGTGGVAVKTSTKAALAAVLLVATAAGGVVWSMRARGSESVATSTTAAAPERPEPRRGEAHHDADRESARGFGVARRRSPDAVRRTSRASATVSLEDRGGRTTRHGDGGRRRTIRISFARSRTRLPDADRRRWRDGGAAPRGAPCRARAMRRGHRMARTKSANSTSSSPARRVPRMARSSTSCACRRGGVAFIVDDGRGVPRRR